LRIPGTDARNAKGLPKRKSSFANQKKHNSGMKAMIFAAGLGTRLLPLTRTKPKALMEVQGKALLQLLIEKLAGAGIRDILINIHHHPDLVLEFLDRHKNFGLNIAVSDERDLLLDTGGGLKKASWFFDDDKPFLLHNVDVISDIDLDDMLTFHVSSKALVTLAIRSRESSRYLLFDRDMRLGGWENTRSGEQILVPGAKRLERYAFSGIHIVDPALLALLRGDGSFSIIDIYLEAASGHPIVGYLHDHTRWLDVGRMSDLERAGRDDLNDPEE
jgi:NDP-sugar pyrophosphorylase family protein